MKQLFQKLSQREKVLLILAAVMGALIWANWIYGRVGEFQGEYTTAAGQIEYQELWLENETSINERLEDALKLFAPEKSYTRSRFIGRVDSLARSSAGSYDVSNPTTQRNDIFDEHRLTVKFRNTSIKDLLVFEKAIEREAPYLHVSKVQINPNSRNPELLNANFDVIALELKEASELNRLTGADN